MSETCEKLVKMKLRTSKAYLIIQRKHVCLLQPCSRLHSVYKLSLCLFNQAGYMLAKRLSSVTIPERLTFHRYVATIASVITQI